MIADPVLIDDDDDVDMKSVVVIDVDDNSVVNIQMDTIDLDDIDNDTGSKDNAQLEDNDVILIDEHIDNENKTDKHEHIENEAFINTLSNNRLLDKLIQKGLSMKNACGMSIIINNILLPIYKNTSDKVKKSEMLKKLLKKTYQDLVKDPDNKFLHMTTLCEELKSQQFATNPSFVTMLDNNRLLNKIVKKCLSMENSSGMPRVINKTLLPLYKDASKTLKESTSFKKLLKKTYKLLERDPNHKFLHIKTLCEEMKSGTCRRKVPFVTLATNLKQTDVDQQSAFIGQQKNETVIPKRCTAKKRSSCGIIVNESTCEKNNTDMNKNTEEDSSLSHVITEHNEKNNYDTNINQNANENSTVTSENKKESISCGSDDKNEKNVNVINLEAIDNSDSESDIIVIEETTLSDIGSANSNKENNRIYNEITQLSEHDSDDEVLVPISHDESSSDGYDTAMEVEALEIEDQIAEYKQQIANLEEKEVTNNTIEISPYIMCSRLKKKLVMCYKRLCEITGNSSKLVKRQEIRLRVVEGHPPGPSKELEKFLNDTIDSTGTLSFPDFHDVIKCVVKSNEVDALGWTQQRIFQEAVALFRICGQALRTRRQQREYRDLLTYVDGQELTDDPAENDPLLLAKLEENKLAARVKEEKLLERYVNMSINMWGTAQNDLHGNRNVAEVTSDSSDSEDTYVVETRHDQNPGITNVIQSDSGTRDAVSKNVLVVNGLCSLNDIREYVSCTSHLNVQNNNPPMMLDDGGGYIEVNIEKSTVYVHQKLVDVQKEPVNMQEQVVISKEVMYDQNESVCNSMEPIGNQKEQVTVKTEPMDDSNELAQHILVEVLKQPMEVGGKVEETVGPQKELMNVIQGLENIQNERLNGHEVPIKVEKETCGVQNEAEDVQQEPVNVKTEPMDDNNKAVMAQHNAVEVPKKLMEVEKEMVRASKELVNVERGLVNIQKEPLNGSELPVNVKKETGEAQNETEDVQRDIVVVLKEPMCIDNNLSDVKNEPAGVNNVPVNVTSVPVNVNNEPVDINNEAIGVNKDLVDVINEPGGVKKEVDVQKDPIDIQSMLDELGPGFVSTVFDIEDPFLVIEISSDSFSDDDL